MAKGKRRGGRKETGQNLASADTVAIGDSRDPANAVPTVRRARLPTDPETRARLRGLRPRRGDQLAHFIIVEQIGEGGMAAVYTAYDPRLDRSVALKLMRPDASEHETPKQGRRRLLREAQALARVSHPNVVVVHEVDEVQGQVYIAMEHVDGGTLRSWVTDAPRTWQDVVSIYCSAGRGLAAAHRAGLVHRDFKPENVLVGDDGRVRVTDFGLVGTTDALAESTPPVDRRGRFPTAVPLSSETEPHGLVLGTPGYVAPELYHGCPADERSDQFSFCVSLFEALYGDKPFEGDNTAEMAANMIDGRMRPPPERSDAPNWVGRVVARGLSIDPAARYASMDELVSALEADPIAARRKRRRTIAAALGFAALAALAVIGFLRTNASAPRPCADAGRNLEPVWNDARKQTVRASFLATGLDYAADSCDRVTRTLDTYASQWTAMRSEACEATRVRGEQSESIMDARMWCLDRRLGELNAYVDVLADAADRAVVERAVDGANALIPIDTCADVEALSSVVPLPEDPARRERARALQLRVDRVKALDEAGKHKDATELARPLVEDARALGWPYTLAGALVRLGDLQQTSGDHEAASATYSEALPLAAESHDDKTVASIYTRMIRVLGHDQARFDEAMRLLPSAEAAVARAGNHLDARASYERAVGLLLDSQGRYEDALAHYRNAVELLRQTLPADHPEVADSLNDVALILDIQGRHEEALRTYEQVLDIEEHAFGPDHPDVARTLNNVGVVLIAMGKHEAALARYARALEIWRKAYGNDHEMVAISVLNMGVVYQNLKKYDLARKAYDEAVSIWSSAQGRNRAHLANALTNLGDLYEDQGQCKRALDYYERGLKTWEEVLGVDHPDLAYALVGLGSCNLELGKPAVAVPLLERALRLRTEHGLDATEIAQAEFLLARALWPRRGSRKRAAELARKARDRYLAEGEPGAESLVEVRAWLAAHGLGRDQSSSQVP